MSEYLRFRIAAFFFRIFWWCEGMLENTPFRTRTNIAYEPISTATLISIIIAGASFGAQLITTMLLAPKPQQQVRGKLTGDITVMDSIIGAEIVRVYGGRPAGEAAGGVEIGANIIYMSEVRKLKIETPSAGSGGKGAPDPPPNVTYQYKVDIAGGVGAGPLRLIRMKWNEDTVFSAAVPVAPTPEAIRYEAEDAGNTRTGTATVTADGACSSGNKVTGIGSGTGTLIINDVYADASTPPLGTLAPEPGSSEVFLQITVHYLPNGAERICTVEIDGTGGSYTFPVPATGTIATKTILREITSSEITNHTVKFSGDGVAPAIDCIDVDILWVHRGTIGPTGVIDPNFPIEGPQDYKQMPDPYQLDTNPWERHNAPIPGSVDGAQSSSLLGGATLNWYEGTATQGVDPIIDAALTARYGANTTPAFRNTAYFSIADLDFSKYGSIPAIRCVVENIELQTVEEILLYEGSLAGIPEEDFDLSLAADRHVRGYYLASLDPPAKAFEDLGVLHNLSFAETHDGVIAAIDLSDRTAVATIPREHLGAFVVGDSEEIPLDDVVTTMPEEAEDLVRSFELQYLNPLQPSDYTTAKQKYNYPYTDSVRNESKSLNITMLPSEAGKLTARELQKLHLKQAPERFIVPHIYAYLNTGECVDVEIDGEFHRRRIEEKTGSAPGVYEIAATNEDIFVLADDEVTEDEFMTAETAFKPKSATAFPANTVGTILDLPPLFDSHDGLTGVYVAGCSKGMGTWAASTVLWLKGADYTPVATLTKQAGMGRAVGVLDDVPGASPSGYLDEDAELTVDFFGDFNPSTVTTEEAEDGASQFIVGNELVIVTTWTRDNDYPNRWVGTDIYRGLRRTIAKTGDHEDEERVVCVNDAIKFVPLDETDIGVERSWKFVTSGAHLADTAEILFTWPGDNQYNREDAEPAVGLTLPAADTSAAVGIGAYTGEAKFRRIEISDNADMSSATEEIIAASEFPYSVLPTSVVLTRPTDTGNITKYIRVSHSSNGRDFGPTSDILPVTFATGGGTGGSGGGFDPDPFREVPVME